MTETETDIEMGTMIEIGVGTDIITEGIMTGIIMIEIITIELEEIEAEKGKEKETARETEHVIEKDALEAEAVLLDDIGRTGEGMIMKGGDMGTKEPHPETGKIL